jgi:hypothetical protein
MADVAVASQLSQWSFEKPAKATRPDRCHSDSSASSPNLCDDAPDALRIETSSREESSSESRKESIILQERYMSSEEDLSPADDGSDSEYDYDDVVIHDAAEDLKARTMSISRWDKGRSCDMAVMVSYARAADRPKVIELDCRSPTSEIRPSEQQRSMSLVGLPFSQLQKIELAQRLSMAPSSRFASSHVPRSTTPATELQTLEPRRPSTSHSPITQKTSPVEFPTSASTTSSFHTASSSRSTSPSVDEAPIRPKMVAREASSSRSFLYIPTLSRDPLSRVQTSRSSFRHSQIAPPTPSSATSLAFLSSDPYETSNTDSASPLIKPAPHKRLRSISMKLALAKIAITPSKKPYDARINGKMPPATPTTPQTAPLQGSSSFASPNRLRRASTILRPKSRHNDISRGPSPDMAPPVPAFNASMLQQRHSSRMVARGASEIEPTLVIPPCPSDDEVDPRASSKGKTLKKRKSLMSLMDVL